MSNIYNFFKAIYQDNEQRIYNKRDIWKDIKQYTINEELIEFEKIAIQKHYSQNYPIIFIVGVPRSGTTLLSQLLIEHLDIGYINNHIAKYWMAPLHSLIKIGLCHCIAHHRSYDKKGVDAHRCMP